MEGEHSGSKTKTLGGFIFGGGVTVVAYCLSLHPGRTPMDGCDGKCPEWPLEGLGLGGKGWLPADRFDADGEAAHAHLRFPPRPTQIAIGRFCCGSFVKLVLGSPRHPQSMGCEWTDRKFVAPSSGLFTVFSTVKWTPWNCPNGT